MSLVKVIWINFRKNVLLHCESVCDIVSFTAMEISSSKHWLCAKLWVVWRREGLVTTNEMQKIKYDIFIRQTMCHVYECCGLLNYFDWIVELKFHIPPCVFKWESCVAPHFLVVYHLLGCQQQYCFFIMCSPLLRI